MAKNNSSYIKQKAIYGIIVLVVRDIGLKVFSIFGQILLVRLIAPEYFGVLAIMLFLVGVGDLVSDLGLTQAIIREKKNLNLTQLSSAFFTRFIFSIVIFFLLLFLFPLIEITFRQLNQGYFSAFALLSLSIVIKNISEFLITFFDKNLKYKYISIIDVAGIIMYFAVAIFLAIEKLYLWNFVYAILAKELLELILAFYFNPWKPKFVMNILSIKKQIKYGLVLQIGNLIALLENSIIPIAGFNLSAKNLGILNWSESVASLSNVIFENYGRVAFSAVAKIQDQKEKINLAISKSINILNIVSYLFVLLVFAYSKDFITLFLTHNWLPAVNALKWFSLSLIFFGGSVSISHAFLAIGKQKQITIISGLVIILEILIALIATKIIGFTGIAAGVFIGSIIQFFGYYVFFLHEGYKINFKNAYIGKIFILTLCIFFALFLNKIITEVNFIVFLIKILLSFVSYFFLLFIFFKSETIEILLLVKNFVEKKSYS